MAVKGVKGGVQARKNVHQGTQEHERSNVHRGRCTDVVGGVGKCGNVGIATEDTVTKQMGSKRKGLLGNYDFYSNSNGRC